MYYCALSLGVLQHIYSPNFLSLDQPLPKKSQPLPKKLQPLPKKCQPGLPNNSLPEKFPTPPEKLSTQSPKKLPTPPEKMSPLPKKFNPPPLK